MSSASTASESRAWQLTTTLLVCPIFTGILVALRMYTRLVVIKKHFWEDLSMAIAMVRPFITKIPEVPLGCVRYDSGTDLLHHHYYAWLAQEICSC